MKLAGVPQDVIDSGHPLDHGMVQEVHRGSSSVHIEGIIQGRREYSKFVKSLSQESGGKIDQAIKLGHLRSCRALHRP
jgi:hypothetical protein